MLTDYGDPLAQEHTTSGGVSAPTVKEKAELVPR